MAFPQITSPPQAQAEVIVNEAHQTLEHQAVYGQRQAAHTGLTWGYYGGRWGGFSIADGTLVLDSATTVYGVVAVASGVHSKSTSITNWNNTTDYVRVYKWTTGASTVTSYEDHRAGSGGVHGTGPGGAALTDGDKGDIVVSSAGTVWNFDTGVVTAFAKTVLDDATAGDQRTTISAAARAQIDGFSWRIKTVADGTEMLICNLAFGYTVTAVTTKADSGTCTVTGKINSTNLGGTANSASTSESTQAHASANVAAVGDDFSLVFASNSACLGLVVTVAITRTLA